MLRTAVRARCLVWRVGSGGCQAWPPGAACATWQCGCMRLRGFQPTRFSKQLCHIFCTQVFHSCVQSSQCPDPVSCPWGQSCTTPWKRREMAAFSGCCRKPAQLLTSGSSTDAHCSSHREGAPDEQSDRTPQHAAFTGAISLSKSSVFLHDAPLLQAAASSDEVDAPALQSAVVVLQPQPGGQLHASQPACSAATQAG